MLVDKFNKYITENKITNRSERLLLGVSGGVDSTVMLDLFIKSGYEVAVAHCNFQLREDESLEDEIHVAEMCHKHGIPIYNIRFDTKGEMQRTKESVQMAARRLRYEWFEKIRSEGGFDKVAIAHNADDSIETFFINLIRGCGIKGLTGINNTNGLVIRPLLFAHRRDIIEHAMNYKIRYREDSSNASTKYLRNKLRLGILPKFREISPIFGQTMISNINRLTDSQAFISRHMELITQRVVREENHRTIINIADIDPLLPLGFVMYELLNRWGFSAQAVKNICDCYHNGDSGRRFYTPLYAAYLDRNELSIIQPTEDDTCTLEIPQLNGEVNYSNHSLHLTTGVTEDIDTLKQPSEIALVDADLLQLPLMLRKWNSGETFVPFGMTGSKKISDFLIDSKISLLDKADQLVISSGEDIVWVVGQRIDDRYKITPATQHYLKIEIHTLPEDDQ